MILDDQIAEEMCNKILDLMHDWSPSDSYADYQCRFCCERPKTNHDSIIHSDDCDGKKFLAALTRTIDSIT